MIKLVPYCFAAPFLTQICAYSFHFKDKVKLKASVQCLSAAIAAGRVFQCTI